MLLSSIVASHPSTPFPLFSKATRNNEKSPQSINQENHSSNKLPTYHIHIAGMVQGVGFRPFVYKIAKQMQLVGYVNNAADGVHIEINADEKTAQNFYHSVINNPPILSKITHHSFQKTTNQPYNYFTINTSETLATPSLMLTPDFAICENCKAELTDKTNRRYQYPFITCTNCGPRYSIITSLPYDREKTTMAAFKMCPQCEAEYHNPEDRRHYSQTNSCAACGITMHLFAAKGEKISHDNNTIVAEIINALTNGKIVAIKGIGGYLLLCDAGNPKAIKELRTRKHRPHKPFALMYRNIEAIEIDFKISEKEKEALQSHAAPIVLLNRKSNLNESIATEEIAPGLSSLGIMLPYSPLLYLIATTFKKPLIATSANVSDSPIIYKNEDALENLSSIADYIITNNREIVLPQDDSVIRFSTLHQQQIIIRRSRGLAPSFFNYEMKNEETFLATGALLKSSFCYTANGNTFISQYLGNTDGYEAQEAYKKSVVHFTTLFQKTPTTLIADKHPNYFSTQFAKEFSEKYNSNLLQVQHHKAHAAAVLAENNLLKNEDPILCVVWDGTGLGDDGNIWGGEFFKYENNDFIRCYYFDYFPIIAGNKMAKEPRLSALAACKEVWFAKDFLKNKFTETEWNFYQTLLEKEEKILCSSVGRIFDAVASLLNLCDRQSYEGQAAMLLEKAATKFFSQNGYAEMPSYFMADAHYYRLPTATLMSGIIRDIQKGKSVNFIAAKFHYSLAHLVSIISKTLAIHKICFSGGVFQNGLLVDLLIENLGNTHQLFFHQALSPNDENVSFGALAVVNMSYELGIIKEFVQNRND